jgi:uncharacterized protein (UPF0276 family)
MTKMITPLSVGVGFKPEHFDGIASDSGPLGFIEIHAENYMGLGGRPHAMLERLSLDFPLSIHGVGLSIGGAGSLDQNHLTRLKTLCERYQPALFSEHLAWSTHSDIFFNDLLPLPYTDETCRTVIEHIDEVQSILKRQILIENPSTYVAFEESTMSEVDFIKEIVRRSGCGLLLDVNNVFVSSTNHQMDPTSYITEFPLHAVREIHLGGHSEDKDDHGNILLIDSHSAPVVDDVWKLYSEIVHRIGPLATLIEWDNDVPEWPVLRREAERANSILQTHQHIKAA